MSVGLECPSKENTSSSQEEEDIYKPNEEKSEVVEIGTEEEKYLYRLIYSQNIMEPQYKPKMEKERKYERLEQISEIESNKEKGQRPFGLCMGEFRVPDDFNQPLPEDIIKQFEGS